METEVRTSGTEPASWFACFLRATAGFPAPIIQLTTLLRNQYYLPVPPPAPLQPFLTHPGFNIPLLSAILPTWSPSRAASGPNSNHAHLPQTNTTRRTKADPNDTALPGSRIPPDTKDGCITRRPATIAHLLVAATLNHLRRAFVPWLGQWMWYAHPLEDLRLALSNPEVFVGEMLGYSWVWVVKSYVLKIVWDLVGWWVCLPLTGRREWEEWYTVGLDGDGRVGTGDDEKKGRGESGRNKREETVRGGNGEDARAGEAWTEMARVAYLVWTMVAAEYVFARAMNTAAWLGGCYRLLARGEVGRAALGSVVRENWIRFPFAVWQLGWYLRQGIWPLVLHSLSWAVRGRPGLLMAVLGCVGSVVSVLRYRSTFYIALEISNMFVFLSHLLVGSIVFGLESVHDALALEQISISRDSGSQGKADKNEAWEKKGQ